MYTYTDLQLHDIHIHSIQSSIMHHSEGFDGFDGFDGFFGRCFSTLLNFCHCLMGVAYTHTPLRVCARVLADRRLAVGGPPPPPPPPPLCWFIDCTLAHFLDPGQGLGCAVSPVGVFGGLVLSRSSWGPKFACPT